MDLKLFFNTIDESLSDKKFSNDSLIQSVYVNEEQMPTIDEADIAIVGLVENRGSDKLNNIGVKHIREHLYGLKKSPERCTIVDLGNLRNGPTLEESYKRLQVVCQYLISKHIFPLIMGGSHDMMMGQYLGYEDEEKLVSIVNIDSKFDLRQAETEEANKRHLHKIFTYEPNFLLNYTHLAFQSYFVNPEVVKVIEQLGFHSLRLGQLREDFKKVEPYVREADMLSFDLGAIQKNYCPGGNENNVFGLTGEEACQIMWYAGMNDKLSSAGIYEYNPDTDDEEHSGAFVVATMMWYFIDGFKNRKREKNFQTNDYIKYLVLMPSEPEEVVFYKSCLSDKWWMEIPNNDEDAIYGRNIVIACDPDDYETVKDGELPERWIRAYNRYS